MSTETTLAEPNPKPTAKRDEWGCTPKQRKFLAVLAKTGNQTEAAWQAFDCKDRAVACSRASETLRIPHVRKEWDRIKAQRISGDAIAARFEDRAGFDMLDLYDTNGAFKPVSEMPEGLRKAIKEIKTEETYKDMDDGARVPIGRVVEVKLHDPIDANVHLAKLQALVGFRQEKGLTVNVNTGGTSSLDPPANWLDSEHAEFMAICREAHRTISARADAREAAAKATPVTAVRVDAVPVEPTPPASP